MNRLWGEIIQLSGLIFLMIGIAIELYYKADIGYIAITVGSLLFALGTKYKHRDRRKYDRARNPFRSVNW